MQVEAGVALEPRLDLGVVVARVVVEHQMYVEASGDFVVDFHQERRNSMWRWRGRHCPITQPESTSRAANSVVVPLRL